MMMNEEVTIVTEPCKISDVVVFAILVNVMNNQNSRVFCFAEPTDLLCVASAHYFPIHTATIYPEMMTRTRIDLIAPLRLA